MKSLRLTPGEKKVKSQKRYCLGQRKYNVKLVCLNPIQDLVAQSQNMKPMLQMVCDKNPSGAATQAYVYDCIQGTSCCILLSKLCSF